MKNYILLTAIIAFILMQTITSASPVYFSDFLGNFGNDESSRGYSRRGSSRRYSSGSSSGEDRNYRSRFNRRPAEKRRGRTYSDICKVITPVNYIRPGAPSVPFCPYG